MDEPLAVHIPRHGKVKHHGNYALVEAFGPVYSPGFPIFVDQPFQRGVDKSAAFPFVGKTNQVALSESPAQGDRYDAVVVLAAWFVEFEPSCDAASLMLPRTLWS